MPDFAPLFYFRRLRAIAGVAAIAAMAACGELTPPEAYSPTTSTTATDGTDIQIDSQVAERSGVDGTVDAFVPTPDPGYVPTLLVSGDPTIVSAEADQSSILVTSLGDVRVSRAVDDLNGGLVIQEVAGSIVYLPAQGQPELLDDSGGRLLDVGHWDGSPRAFVEVDGQVEWIRLASTGGDTERERTVHFPLAEGEEIVSFAASRDLQAVIVRNDECGELRFYGAAGEQLDLQGPDEPECTFPGRPAFGAVALSPDGDAVVYTNVLYRGDGTEAATELVSQELIGESTGFVTGEIGEDLDSIISLSYDGDRVAYVKESGDDVTVTLQDLVDRQDVPVDLLGSEQVYSVSFARLPIAPVE